jgi:hypothetical protein
MLTLGPPCVVLHRVQLHQLPTDEHPVRRHDRTHVQHRVPGVVGGPAKLGSSINAAPHAKPDRATNVLQGLSFVCVANGFAFFDDPSPANQYCRQCSGRDQRSNALR